MKIARRSFFVLFFPELIDSKCSRDWDRILQFQGYNFAAGISFFETICSENG